MFHFTNFGDFGKSLPRDLDGYVPEAGDSIGDFRLDLEEEEEDNTEWWTEFVADAVEKTEAARWSRGRVARDKRVTERHLETVGGSFLCMNKSLE